ncbi:hypothetical protein JYU34_006534 [Plutella xylostella]|uniref:Alpha-carbonic anhydrase domain-containing protein n=1 Tax=Plutella xylostella TaxID=51655 RepID=A0ABQ7QSB6_PLUXY|nr:hypothetical protein JYU34_006534 [Plutella xylostella]
MAIIYNMCFFMLIGIRALDPSDRADLSPFSAQTQPSHIVKHNPTPAEEIYEWLRNKNNILSNYKAVRPYQDDATCRPNTLSDDADDIQRQLDSEARDRFKYGLPKTIWILNFPFTTPVSVKRGLFHGCASSKCQTFDTSNEAIWEWSYPNECQWACHFPACGGPLQSPINLRLDNVVRERMRPLDFHNWNQRPEELTLRNDGEKLVITGRWAGTNMRPAVSGGPLYRREYWFHSLHLHWPSEHAIDDGVLPFETQSVHVADGYCDLAQATNAFTAGLDNKSTVLIISNMYRYSDIRSELSDLGLLDSLRRAARGRRGDIPLPRRPLSFYVPRFQDYATYRGSVPFPPCTPCVTWVVRGRPRTVPRCAMHYIKKLNTCYGAMEVNTRSLQWSGNRKVLYYPNYPTDC